MSRTSRKKQSRRVNKPRSVARAATAKKVSVKSSGKRSRRELANELDAAASAAAGSTVKSRFEIASRATEAAAAGGDHNATAVISTSSDASAHSIHQRDPRLPLPGSVLVKRDRRGVERCECTVEEQGIRYRGVLHRSLSAAAKAAARDIGVKESVNGYVFWGLIRVPHSMCPPEESLRRIALRYEERAAALVTSGTAVDSSALRRALQQHVERISDLIERVAA